MDAASAFTQDRDGDGLPNGFESAFGTNWAPGSSLIKLRLVSGVPVVEVPKQKQEAHSYVRTVIETTSNLGAPAWTTNGLHAVQSADTPANCNWFQPDATGTNRLFRLRGMLLE